MSMHVKQTEQPNVPPQLCTHAGKPKRNEQRLQSAIELGRMINAAARMHTLHQATQ
jgi:hypothetical protein